MVEHRVADDEPGALAGELGVVEGRLVRVGANDAAQHEVELKPCAATQCPN